ncbi:hypothetical protein N7466_010661 [Penicillium verhagenii]|uniref:uncharacterized protein n=1 Tax=Penicillium verhagenii TaxID=1562060 RepID=UPI00254581DF|nr:uncharacterized protein N7466_010661 [Penicillium verhagenii]KAJ5918669.1 hypothetical protein N7466_010661 [Penicillium verhagenii]
MADKQSNSSAQLPAAVQEKRDQLEDLITRATAKDATKDHNSASELYSQATELQAELNGELSPENANLLYAYGKSLYNVAVSKSDVLGSKVAGEPQGQHNKAPSANASSTGATGAGGNSVRGTISSALTNESSPVQAESEVPLSKPFFQFTGDENFVDSDEEDEEDADAGDEEDEDDFANAFEVLDLARILYLKKLEAVEESDNAKGKSTDLSTEVKHIKERLADTYDLQAEISLEAERFSDAVTDLRTALDLRYSLFPFEDPSVAECHYKLSLALEFASVPRENEDEEAEDDKEKTVDEKMRKEAAVQMERAIESCKVRMAHEEKKVEIQKHMDEDKLTASKRKIANVKEIIADMEQRLIDLRRSPVTVDQGNQENEAFLKGILGQIVGQSANDQKVRLDSANKGATDVSSLVRRKPAAQPASQSTASKRSVEDAPSESDSKRARVDDTSSTK